MWQILTATLSSATFDFYRIFQSSLTQNTLDSAQCSDDIDSVAIEVPNEVSRL